MGVSSCGCDGTSSYISSRCVIAVATSNHTVATVSHLLLQHVNLAFGVPEDWGLGTRVCKLSVESSRGITWVKTKTYQPTRRRYLRIDSSYYQQCHKGKSPREFL
ncbi:hypothetical protein E2C01_046868 [Portunus trituberculatus]|uniref:Uncharacterized protein n=1 Tax=Portunus trituberculatus TaxID=210409 RepID=A0A5B7G689_PORTR|nr:hypothetical protein [Portunus trituberculatus]